MSNVIEVKPVVCETTQEKGSMYIVATKDTSAKFHGISLFFQPLNGERKYVKSFLLDAGEYKAFVLGYATTTRDLGYILTAQNSYIEVMALNSSIVKPIEDNELYYRGTLDRATFNLDVPEYYWNQDDSELVKEYHDNNNLCGLRLALVNALREAEESTNLASCIFPKVCCITTKEYK